MRHSVQTKQCDFAEDRPPAPFSHEFQLCPLRLTSAARLRPGFSDLPGQSRVVVLSLGASDGDTSVVPEVVGAGAGEGTAVAVSWPPASSRLCS